MPKINIHGASGNGRGESRGPGGNWPKGPRSQILDDIRADLTDNPQRAADYARAQAQANQRGKSDDYDRAQKQQTAQRAAQTAAALRRQRQEDAMYRQRDRDAAAAEREKKRIESEEIKAREQQLRDDKRAAAEAKRRRDADERAQDRLDRHNQRLNSQRLNQERALRNQFNNLAYRAGGNL